MPNSQGQPALSSLGKDELDFSLSEKGHGRPRQDRGDCPHFSTLGKDAGVVQLVERLVANEKVVGSNPIARSTLRMADFVGH